MRGAGSKGEEGAGSWPISAALEIAMSLLFFHSASISVHFCSVSIYVFEVTPKCSPVRTWCLVKLQRACSQSANNRRHDAVSQKLGT